MVSLEIVYNLLKLNGLIQSYNLQFKFSLSHAILNCSLTVSDRTAHLPFYL
jgi:hypothetical protein